MSTVQWERLGEGLKQNVVLAPYTTLRVGGPADLFYVADTTAQVIQTLQLAAAAGVPTFILGGGSNICVADQGVRGLVVQIASRGWQVEASTADRDQVVVSVEAGTELFTLIQELIAAGIGGLERMAGIPGSVGGAIFGNAGAFGTAIGDRLLSATVLLGREGGQMRVETVGPDFFSFGYHTTRLTQGGDGVVLNVRLHLWREDVAKLTGEAEAILEKRRQKQPEGYSAGSFFRNPIIATEAQLAAIPVGLAPHPLVVGGRVPAGFLLELVGAKGMRVGGACISSKHGNFLINTGKATAGEIRTLAEHLQSRVYDRFGIRLEEEVRYVGDWSGWKPVTSREDTGK